MHFSLVAESLAASKNLLYLLRDELSHDGSTVIDLVRGNVNEHGIVFPPELLNSILRDAAESARVYRPDSFGQTPAREAVARYYNGHIPSNQIVITPGTSVSYWYCFKLLAEAGDEILCPQPSYPLFDYIAQLCGVQMTHYRLVESRDWAIDLDHLEHQITTATRAIVLISPHNPTGMVADRQQLEGLAEIALRHALPIISDEVFNEFIFGLDSFPRIAGTEAPLVFTLNGFSKMFALPGIKIGWMAVTGEQSLVRKAVSALELISRYPIESAQARIGLISFSFVICKAALEAVTGRMFFGFLAFGLLGQPVAVSHAGGIIGGLLALLFDRRVEGGKKKGLSLN